MIFLKVTVFGPLLFCVRCFQLSVMGAVEIMIKMVIMTTTASMLIKFNFRLCFFFEGGGGEVIKCGVISLHCGFPYWETWVTFRKERQLRQIRPT